jgi:hypothetical protein
MTMPIVSQFYVDDGVNERISISIDRDADVRSYVLDPDGGGDNLYVTLDGLRALVAAAEQLEKS